MDDIDTDWNGANPYIKIFKISPQALALIKSNAPKSIPLNTEIKDTKKQNSSESLSENKNPKDVLREYQKEALVDWAKNKHRGILALATGTGKTKTAIHAIKEFRKKRKASLVIITVPYIPLAKQWIDELNTQNLSTIEIFETKNDWLLKAQNLLELHNQSAENSIDLPIFVCVNKSFRGGEFQNLLNRLEVNDTDRLIIVDECHHFNRIEQIKFLPEKINYRLGLSATPYEPNEVHILENYFGKNIFEYPIKKAIGDGYLCAYEYFPIFIEFTNEEAEAYIKTIHKIQNSKKTGDIENNPEQEFNSAFDEIDRLLETLIGKLSKLEEILEQFQISNFTLFYCGQGYVEIGNERIRQIEMLTRLLSKLKWKVGRITYSETYKEKLNTLHDFKNKNINAIASMRILDEGIDVPDCTSAFILASQRLIRQGIQRRGRILRKSDSKTTAKLFDFIITGPKLSNQELEKLYTRELQRAKMFADDAINKNQCTLLLGKI